MVSLSINNPVHSGVDSCEVSPPLNLHSPLDFTGMNSAFPTMMCDLVSDHLAPDLMQAGLHSFFDVHCGKRPSRWPFLC